MKKATTILCLLIAFGSFAELEWIQKANFRGSGRHRGSGFSIMDKGYIGMGHINSVVNIPFADIWEYDPATDTWSQKADYPTGGNYGMAVFTIDNKAYLGNGVYSSGEFLSFDPILNVWDTIASCPNTSSEATAFSLGDKGYFAADNELYEYDPSNDNWTLKAAPPGSFGYWISSFSIGNKGYVFTNGNLFEYKQSVNEWAVRAPKPGISTAGAASFAINERGYVVAGYGGWLSEICNETWEFNPGSNEWKQVADFPGSKRRFVVGFSIDNVGYVGTGTNGVNFNDFYQFAKSERLYGSVEDDFKNHKVNVYPNPATNYISIEFPTKKSAWINLYDLIGKRVVSKSIVSGDKVDVSNLSPGNYTYTLKNNSSVLGNGKLIIQ